MSNRHNNIPWRPVRKSSCACIVFLLFLMLIFGQYWEDYTSLFPILFIILILGSCIMTAISQKKRAQRAQITPSPESQTDVSNQSIPFGHFPPQTSFGTDIQYQPLQSNVNSPPKMMKLCPMCGAQLDDEILKQLIISGRAYCKFCGNQIQK